MPVLPPLILVLIAIGSTIFLVFVAFSWRLGSIESRIASDEERVIARYRDKINKIPALVEIMRKYTAYDDIFLEIIHLHKIATISNVTSIYDLLESNSRIHREFLFLMRVSMKISDLHRDGNFLYIRDFIMFYENALTKEIESVNLDIVHYNRLRSTRKYTLI